MPSPPHDVHRNECQGSTIFICSSGRRKCFLSHEAIEPNRSPGKVANPARGQLNRENEYFPVPIRA